MKQKNSNYQVSKTLGEMAKKIEIVNDLQGWAWTRAPKSEFESPMIRPPN